MTMPSTLTIDKSSASSITIKMEAREVFCTLSGLMLGFARWMKSTVTREPVHTRMEEMVDIPAARMPTTTRMAT